MGVHDSGKEEEPVVGDAPPLADGYNQTYIVRNPEQGADPSSVREVLFRCGNWCYRGDVSFAGLSEGFTLREIPRAIPILQRQQSRLKFFCCASSVPPSSPYAEPMQVMRDAQEFVARELSSDDFAEELARRREANPWVDDDDSKTYFELSVNLPPCMNGLALMASKTYARGLIFITVYFEGSFYIVMQDGEGDQALLDIRFPDVSQHGQGLCLANYPEERYPLYRKLTLWMSLAGITAAKPTPRPASMVHNLSSSSYIQTYVVMHPNKCVSGESVAGSNASPNYRDVLFRFGSWCYCGTVQLSPKLALPDLPHVIPALRMQQARLDFLCDAAAVPAKSPFAAPLRLFKNLAPLVEEEIVASESVLSELMSELGGMGLADSVEEWLEGDSQTSFFEFTVVPDAEMLDALRNVDLIASKVYSAQGIVTMTLWFQGVFYVVLQDGGKEQPLLDSRFPDVSSKGRGYQVRTCPTGVDGWPNLRRVSVWQTIAAMAKEVGAKEPATSAKAVTEQQTINSPNTFGERRSAPHAEPKSPSSVAGDADSAAGGGAAATASKPTAARHSASSSKEGPEGAQEELFVRRSASSAGAAGKAASASLAERKLELEAPIRGRAQLAGGGSGGRGGDAGGGFGQGDIEAEDLEGASEDAAERKEAKEPAPLRAAAAKQLTATRVALPHHLKPMEGMAGQMEDRLRRMREELGDTLGEAPWDAAGRPKTALGSKPLRK